MLDLKVKQMYTFICMLWKQFSLLLCNIYKKAQVNEKIKTSYKILPFTQQHDYSDELLMCLRTHDRKKKVKVSGELSIFGGQSGQEVIYFHWVKVTMIL